MSRQDRKIWYQSPQAKAERMLKAESRKLDVRSGGSIVNVPFQHRQQKAEWLRLTEQRTNPFNQGMLPWQPMAWSRLDIPSQPMPWKWSRKDYKRYMATIKSRKA